MRTFIQIIVVAFAMAGIGHAATRVCEGTQISVRAQQDNDVALACESAQRALAFFAGLGFRADIAATIIVEDALAMPSDCLLLGSFDGRSSEIRVLTLEKATQSTAQELPFGEPMQARLHASFIVHELAHALAKANFRIARPSTLAHEYVAYAVQLATMHDELRQSILTRYDLEGFQHEREISETYYLVNPHAFAVKAFLHFRRPENGAAFMQRVFEGLLSPTQRRVEPLPDNR